MADIVAAAGGVRRVEQAIQDEIQRIELGAETEAAVVVPDKGRQDLAVGIDVAEVAGERRKVVCGVAEFEHGGADDIGGGLGAEHASVGSGGSDGELFDYIPVEMSTLRLLTRYIVENQSV